MAKCPRGGVKTPKLSGVPRDGLVVKPQIKRSGPKAK